MYSNDEERSGPGWIGGLSDQVVSRRAHRLRLAVCAVLVCGLLLFRCDATPRGTLAVTYQFVTPEGVPLTCAELGAASLEVTLFHLDGDSLPYHRQTVVCETSAGGTGAVELTVDARRYARLVLRLVGSGGATVRFCVDGNTEEARIIIDDCIVTKDTPARADWFREAWPGSCAAVSPAPLTSASMCARQRLATERFLGGS